jgi:CheY-like chemotaxis protein
VLFVEDDPQTRESIVQSLFLNGFRVLAAESAFRGLRVPTQEHVDVLSSDVVMPGMAGIDLAEKTRRLRPHL